MTRTFPDGQDRLRLKASFESIAIDNIASSGLTPLMAPYNVSKEDRDLERVPPSDAAAQMDKLNSDPLDAVERCVAAAMKGFVIGAGLKGGLALFGILGRLRQRASRR